MFEPTRGGTRGGAGEFKWSDVSADKDREHYLGHSVNAPTGRWQKNKDVHWYNRDKNQPEDERAAELLKIKEAEKEAMAAALGYGPSKPAGDASTTGSNAIPVASKPDQKEDEVDEEEKTLSKEERKRLKAERKRLKEERKREERERRAMQAVSSSSRHRDDDDRDYSRDRHRHSYDRRERSGGRARSRSASPRRGERESKHRRRDSLGRKRSLTPLDDRPWMGSSKRDEKEDRDYTVEEMERERNRDRRRWEDNLARQETAREKMRM